MRGLGLALLGQPAVELDGAPVAFDTRKAVALLALLAVTGREQSRERVAALLWPDSDTARARGSLRRTLSVTAAAVGPALAVARTSVALVPGRARVDVTDFETLAARADAASLQRAVRLYRDDFLTGFTMRGCDEFDDWRSATADHLKQVLAGALDRLAAAAADAGDHARAIEAARRWLALDPLHEPAHQALIRLLAESGQRSAALRQYRALVAVLDRELAVRPLPETTRLYDDVRAGRLIPVPGEVAAAGGERVAARARARARVRGTRPAQAGPEWPVVGRAAELAAFEEAWGALRGSEGAGQVGQILAVVGEAGSGKTRLVEEFRSRVASDNGVVVYGRCHDGESGLPFALAVDLLRSASGACPDLPDRLPAHAAAMVGRLVPELAEAHSGEPVPPLASPAALTRLYGAVGTALVVSASAARGLAVVAEDVGWADGPSLDLLAYLARRPAAWPLLLVLTWRHDHAERLRGLSAALEEAAAAGRGQRLEPQPLRAGEIADVLRAVGLPGTDPAWMLAETKGHPLLVREYAEALRSGRDTGQPVVGQDGWAPPESVRVLLTRRLHAAGEPALQVLATAAVLGADADEALLRLVSGRSEAETVDGLDDALSRFLLTEVVSAGEPGVATYDFPYEALRRVAYESASIARRRLLHGRAAGALAARYDRDPLSVRAATVAMHLQRAGRDSEAAGWWWRAAQRSRDLYAHADAHAHLRQALALGYPRVAVCTALGDVLTVLGRYREALAEYEAAAAAADGDAAGLAGIEHKLAEVHHRLGEWALADAHLSAAAELLPADAPGAWARMAADRAVVACRRGDTGEAMRLGEQALAGAREAADPAATAQALNVLGMVAARDGDRAAAMRHLLASLAQAREVADKSVAVAALNNLARLLADAGDHAGALPLAEEALALGSELGDAHRVAALHTNLADLLHAMGQQEAALKHLKESARRFASVDSGGPTRPEIWTLVEW